MSNVQKMTFGQVNDNDQSLKSKVGGVFGLNPSVNFTKIAYNPTAGADGAAADAVDINVKVGDREYNTRIYDVTGGLYNAKNELVEAPGEGEVWSDEYTTLYNTEMKQRMAVIIHAVKAAGVTQAQLDTALATPLATFAAWAEVVCALLPANYTTNPIDVFLQYQWNIKDGQDRTFLEVSKNMKGGRFFCASVAAKGQWNEVFDATGLKYVDSDGGAEHPFTRSSNFMESPKAYLQVEGEENGPRQVGGGNSNFQEGNGAAAKKSTW